MKKKRLNTARACKTGREKSVTNARWSVERNAALQGHWWWYNKKRARKFLAAFLSSPFFGSKDGWRGRRKCTPLHSFSALADTCCFAILSRLFSVYIP